MNEFVEEKNRRVAVMLDIIKNGKYSTYEQVIAAMGERGCPVTKGTLSHYMNENHIVKAVLSNGEVYYMVPEDYAYQSSAERFSRIFIEAVLDVVRSGNFIKVSCVPGMASAVRTCIDGAQWYDDVFAIFTGGNDVFILIQDGGDVDYIYQSLVKAIH